MGLKNNFLRLMSYMYMVTFHFYRNKLVLYLTRLLFICLSYSYHIHIFFHSIIQRGDAYANAHLATATSFAKHSYYRE